ncbi:Unannotated [Lentimonas sp. CC19]|nr:Unannotated [Lentimonas sp. CC10]CAA6693232.1 Unannotated [Lentimonas sp. CC19]CAA7068756.1 Unannotated [Lentimonas sp. CC11]
MNQAGRGCDDFYRVVMLNRKHRGSFALCFAGCLSAFTASVEAEVEVAANEVKPLITWLLEDEGRLDDVPFSDVVSAVSGCQVLPVDSRDPVDAWMADALATALNDCMAELNVASHPIHRVGRVNEISRYVEDSLLKLLNAKEELLCEIPVNASGGRQRSGYPDLRLLHRESGRVFYIDPKIYKLGSEQSSFRTFYFEPKKATNKILDDASHLIVGVAHGGKVDGQWQLKHWKMVDLIDFNVRLKAEFQASNRDLYQPTAIIRKSNDPVD